MGDPYKGRLAGHSLVNEGRLFNGVKGAGMRSCSCGRVCFCVSDNDAKIWHREHKADVLDSWVIQGCDDRGREIHL